VNVDTRVNEWPPRYLLLATGDGLFGYTRLSAYINRSLLIASDRTEPKTVLGRGAVRVLHALSTSRWYRISSLDVELRAWWKVQTGFKGLVHFLWAERDWGFFDRFPTSSILPICATFHGCPDTLPEVIRDTRRLQRLDAIILMSEVQRAFFESAGVPSHRIHVIHHGVDCGHFRPPFRHPTGPFTVLCVGSYRRNFALLHKVSAMLEPHRDIRIKIVAPKEIMKIFGNMRNVEVVSDLTDEQLIDAYHEASCLLMTVEAATANNTVVEAMACGLPIVSEDVGGIPEYTGPGCAIICQPQSAGALKDAVLTLHRDPDLAARMGRLARERAAELDWSLVAKRTLSVYEQVLTGRCVPSFPMN
jgi:glycosyltransferase involved in cell wall biosynthesis